MPMFDWVNCASRIDATAAARQKSEAPPLASASYTASQPPLCPVEMPAGSWLTRLSRR